MLKGLIFYLKIDNTSLFNNILVFTKTKKWNIYCHSLCDRAWIRLQVTYSTFQINPIFMSACTFYQHKDKHFLTKCQTCLSLLAHIINDSMWTLMRHWLSLYPRLLGWRKSCASAYHISPKNTPDLKIYWLY